MKIGFVCGNYLPFMGGVEIHARQVSQELSKRHEVVLMAMNFAARRLPHRLATLHNNLLAPFTDDRTDGRVPIKALAPNLLGRMLMLPLALRAIPRKPLIADPPTHAIAGTELAHREAIAQRVSHKLQSLVHRSTRPPWHRRPRRLEIRRAG